MTTLKEMKQLDITALAAAPSFPVSSLFSVDDLSLFNYPRYSVFTGFCDLHVHIRAPGFYYK